MQEDTGSVHNIGIGDILRSHALSYPLKTATVYRERRLSYPQLNDSTTRLANALRNKGAGENSPIMWLGQNSDRLLEVVLAAAKIGAIVCPVNWRLAPSNLADLIDDFQPTIIFWQQEEVGEQISSARQLSAQNANALWIQIDSEINQADSDAYQQLLESGSAQDDETFVHPDTALLQIYTSGFDGKLKGALMSHRAIMQQSLLFASIQQIDANYVFLNSGPMFHMGVWMTTWPTFFMGGTNVFARRVQAEELCRLIDNEKCNGAYTVNSTQEEMVAINHDGRYNLKSLRSYPGSDAWNTMTNPSDCSWYTCHPLGYGQTEVMGFTTFNSFDPDMLGSHGRPSPLIAMRIFDGDGNDVPQGEIGEIVIRGPTVMNGYYRAGEAPETRTINGWHQTNDLGRREKDGSITFIGPKQRMLKSGVENIYPIELERSINNMPGVVESAIIGVPHPKWIQTVVALVVRENDSPNEETVIAHCKEKLASYKKPSQVIFLDSLPKLDSGAIDYDQLDSDHGGGGYPGAGTASR